MTTSEPISLSHDLDRVETAPGAVVNSVLPLIRRISLMRIAAPLRSHQRSVLRAPSTGNPRGFSLVVEDSRQPEPDCREDVQQDQATTWMPMNGSMPPKIWFSVTCGGATPFR